MPEWWRDAVFYEVYVRSFADSNGDGFGDLPGIRQRLPYLQDLGIDAIWLTPFYPSPGIDHGYDVANYVDVDPLFGTLADFDELLAANHELGMRLIVDIVPNHTSSAHPWFAGDRSRYVTAPVEKRPAEQLALELGRAGVDARRDARGVLPASVCAGAARSRLAQRASACGLRGDPPLLARPRRRRLPHRRRARRRQGRLARRRAGAVPGVTLLVRLAHCDRPAGGARDLPRLAPPRRLLRRPGARRRDRLLGSDACRALPSLGRAPPCVQLLTRLPAVGRGGDPRVDRRVPRGAPDRHVGARESRRHPHRNALRPARGARGRAAPAGAARPGLPLPGPGARAPGSRPARRVAPGPGLHACPRRAEGTRRVPRAASVDARATGAVVATGAGVVARAQRGGAARGRRVRAVGLSARDRPTA